MNNDGGDGAGHRWPKVQINKGISCISDPGFSCTFVRRHLYSQQFFKNKFRIFGRACFLTSIENRIKLRQNKVSCASLAISFPFYIRFTSRYSTHVEQIHTGH
ncbi:hypothetical protein CSKR_201627 [Clonorchis sinensis]|uniref:Uncharacterized protein n=1 Tax=Clonorchis sinensis TaxID=79923 RepID=A0A8T1MS81_CLOSI|nr:hypothetical protein CSKR_201627 [Clonorchis sinensis]